MSRVSINVECADAIHFSADVLGLKYAQAFWGLDQSVISRLINSGNDDFMNSLPQKGDSLVISTNNVISAPNVLLVGVESITEFDYVSVRYLGYQFVASLAAHQLQKPFLHLAITVHGVGFGLSLLEAFRAELLGIADAYQKGEFPENLTKITFVERRTEVARIIASELETMMKAHPAVRAMVEPDSSIHDSTKVSKTPDKFIFISYARKDESIALRIADDLRQEQLPVWMDQINIGIGDPWDRTIQEALRNSYLMLLILTNESGQSENVADEYHYFLTNNKPIFPLLAEPFDMEHMPYRLSRRHYVDFRENYENSLKKLVEALRTELKRF